MNYLVNFTDSKVENIILNICILLFGINFLYKCNYIVMGTFVLLLIFKRFRINFGNLITLIALLLFSISWFMFSDGHEIAGICLPLCYLIGCNIDEHDEKGITKFILLVAISLALYTTLFFINNAIVNEITNYDVYNQQNIWTGRPLWATNIMLYSSLFYSCFGYIVFSDKLNNKFKIIYIIVFIINAFYALMLGRRAALLMIVLSAVIACIYKLIFGEKEEKQKTLKFIIIVGIIGIVSFILFFIAYMTNIFGFKYFIKETDLYTRFISNPNRETSPMYWISKFLSDSGRSVLRKKHLKYFWSYPWGGSNIREIVGNYAHDLWLDVHDVSGIVTLVIVIVYSIMLLISFVKAIINKSITYDLKMLLLCLLICIFAQFSIEPIMEACRAYMFAVCMINGSIDKIGVKKND